MQPDMNHSRMGFPKCDHSGMVIGELAQMGGGYDPIPPRQNTALSRDKPDSKISALVRFQSLLTARVRIEPLLC